MLKLFKYFKHCKLLFVVCLIMLFVQAMSNLYLPSYMANIVNVGIQEYGVEEDSPNAISEYDLFFISSYMLSKEENEIIEKSYHLIKPNTDEYQKYVETYPAIKTENVYAKNEIDDTTLEKLDKIFGKVATSIYYITHYESMIVSGEMPSDDLYAPSQIKKFSDIISSLRLNGSYQYLKTVMNQFEDRDASFLQSYCPTIILSLYKDLNVDISSYQSSYIWHNGFVMIALSLLTVISAILVSYCASKIAAIFGKQLRHSLFKKVQTFSDSEFNKFPIPTLITRTTNDITQTQDITAMAIKTIIYSPVMAIGGIVLAFSQDLAMTGVIIAGVIAIILLMVIVCIITIPKFDIIQKFMDRIGLIMRENLSGAMVVRAFGKQKAEKERFNNANIQLTKLNKFVNNIIVIIMPSMTLIMNVVCILVLWVGANEMMQANIKVGNMIAFIQYAMIVMFSFLMLSVIFAFIPRVVVTSRRISDVLETEPVIQNIEKSTEITKKSHNILSFENVSLRYGNSPKCAIENITFEVKSGETIAFIGSTGSGKSTIARIIPRFIEPTDGKIAINSSDIGKMNIENLRKNIGFVPQRCVLFSGTIRSNLLFGNEDATEEEIVEACKIAQIWDFVKSKSKGLDSEISRGGTNVSGGQRQRLCIARAILRDAMVYVFDDSFSALDFKTDKEIRLALKKHIKNSITVIVAQRINTIMDADKIVVLDKGKIVGTGQHDELLKNCEIYREIAESQLSKED